MTSDLPDLTDDEVMGVLERVTTVVEGMGLYAGGGIHPTDGDKEECEHCGAVRGCWIAGGDAVS